MTNARFVRKGVDSDSFLAAAMSTTLLSPRSGEHTLLILSREFLRCEIVTLDTTYGKTDVVTRDECISRFSIASLNFSTALRSSAVSEISPVR